MFFLYTAAESWYLWLIPILMIIVGVLYALGSEKSTIIYGDGSTEEKREGCGCSVLLVLIGTIWLFKMIF